MRSMDILNYELMKLICMRTIAVKPTKTTSFCMWFFFSFFLIQIKKKQQQQQHIKGRRSPSLESKQKKEVWHLHHIQFQKPIHFASFSASTVHPSTLQRCPPHTATSPISSVPFLCYLAQTPVNSCKLVYSVNHSFQMPHSYHKHCTHSSKLST